LQAPGHTEDEYQALRYELGAAYEQLGDLKQAREFYTEVYGVDVSYREVAEKLSQLRQKQE
jgi:Flp pilus assembly protein TadD